MVKLINISLKKLISEPLRLSSDTIGAFASGLCILHCLSTPIFFVVSACSASCCSSTPLWWQWMDYLFLLISFFAIYHTTKSITMRWVSQGLWISWAVLLILILNVKLELVLLNQNIKFIPAFLLVFLHSYNLRYCKCEQDCCWHQNQWIMIWDF